MSDLPLTIYHHLPYPARAITASLRGLYLRRWRYGPDAEQQVAEATGRESWSLAQWQRWQAERLAYVLHRAATQVPYYQAHWASRRRQGDHASWEVLANWPIVEKEALRQHPTAFVAADCDIRRMFHEHTSGTSGKSLDLWWSRDTVRQWYALFEARCRRWYGVSRHDRWAIWGGQLVAPVSQHRPPFWVWNAALNQLYLSSYHLAPDLIPFYLEALRQHRISYLWGYTSSLYALAQEALRLGQRDLKMTVALTNAEPLFDYQREAIAAAFHCPVRETYGMAEIVAAASECEHGHLHLWPEVGQVEVLQHGQPVPPGAAGELVCTGLLNADMPLIRYRLGDSGKAPHWDSGCPCGRTLPLLPGIEGRTDDVLYTADGRLIGRLDPVFKTHLPVREAQIIQETLQQVRVRYVPAPEFTPEAASSIIKRLQARMGAVEVILEEVKELPRTASGKFRAVICNLPPQQKQRLQQFGKPILETLEV